MSKKDNFGANFFRQMNDMADFKDFGKPNGAEEPKINEKDSAFLCHILSNATVFDVAENQHTVEVSCYEWKWNEKLKLNCLCYSPENAMRLSALLKSIAMSNRREVDIYKPPAEAKQ